MNLSFYFSRVNNQEGIAESFGKRTKVPGKGLGSGGGWDPLHPVSVPALGLGSSASDPASCCRHPGREQAMAQGFGPLPPTWET